MWLCCFSQVLIHCWWNEQTFFSGSTWPEGTKDHRLWYYNAWYVACQQHKRSIGISVCRAQKTQWIPTRIIPSGKQYCCYYEESHWWYYVQSRSKIRRIPDGLGSYCTHVTWHRWTLKVRLIGVQLSTITCLFFTVTSCVISASTSRRDL